ncbi:MAG: hypothetical protein ACOY4R_14235 [Pseudomonadota bacterium]
MAHLVQATLDPPSTELGAETPASPTVYALPPMVVIDTIPGGYKTTFILNHMNKAHSDYLSGRFMGTLDDGDPPPRFLYVTPLLDEVERVKARCPDLNFRDPVPVHGRKFFDLERLVDAGECIATTHELFRMLTPRVVKRLQEQGYELVIDEVLTCVDYFKYDEDDVASLFQLKQVYIDAKTNRLRWNHDLWPDYDGKHEQVKNLCDCGNLVAWSMEEDGFKPGKKGSLLLWAFPAEFLAAFQSVHVLTYLFAGSPMRAYLDAQGVDFEMRTVINQGTDLAPWSGTAEGEAKARIRTHLKVYEGPLNAIGERPRGTRANPLSKNWFLKGGEEKTKRVRSAATNYFRDLTRGDRGGAKATSRELAWTTFKPFRSKLAGKGYKHHTQWIPLNAKASNDWRHKTAVAYLANRFALPEIANFFESHDIDIHENCYALSEMLQWLWRSAIRDDKEPKDVHVFVPSKRMRELLKLWLECDDAATFVAKAKAFNVN